MYLDVEAFLHTFVIIDYRFWLPVCVWWILGSSPSKISGLTQLCEHVVGKRADRCVCVCV